MFGDSLRNNLSICCPLLIATIAFVAGCNNAPVASLPSENASKTETEAQATLVTSTASIQTSSVMPSKTDGLASPAAKVNELPPPESEPDQVCKKFMQLLQSGNRISAENLLTKTALMTTTKAELTLEPMGGPASNYDFTEVRYATTRKKLAQVDCAVVEKINGEECRMEMTWVVRKQSQGWRISGVMLELEQGQAKDFLSFENHQDVQRMKMLAGSDVIDQPEGGETRQANATSNNNNTIK